MTLQFILVLSKQKEINLVVDFSINFAIITSLLFTLAYIIWQNTKSVIIENKELLNKDVIRNRNLFKYKTFKSILKSGKYYDIEQSFININELYKPHNITIITDPFCEHCKKAHQELHSLSTQLKKDINYNIVFNIDINEEPDIDKSIYRSLMSFQISKNQLLLKRALNDWYEHENDEKWLSKYSQKIKNTLVDDILNKQNNWCKKVNLNFTPVLFINGYKLPNIYRIKDLFFLIEEINEDTNF